MTFDRSWQKLMRQVGLVVINGQQIYQEAYRESVGLGYAHPSPTQIHCSRAHVRVSYPRLSGSSGYGGFCVEDFTDLRIVTIHPPGSRALPLVG